MILKAVKKCIGLLLVTAVISCAQPNNRLVGHTYNIEPINQAIKLKLMFSSAKITHTYISNSNVNVVTYIGNEPSKTEIMNYSFNGDKYEMGDDEVYDVSFKGDTVILRKDSTEFLKLIPVK